MRLVPLVGVAVTLVLTSGAGASELAFSTLVGGEGWDQVDAVAVGADGSTYVAGAQDSACFPTTAGALATSGSGSFVQKLGADETLAWSTVFPEGTIHAMAVGPDGSVTIAGETRSDRLPVVDPVQPRRADPPASPETDAFVARVDPTGRSLVFATYLGGVGPDVARHVALGSDGRIVVAGTTRGRAGDPGFPIVGGFRRERGDHDVGHGGDAFIACLAADGRSLLWSTYLGGSGADLATGAGFSPDGAVVVVGHSSSSDFPVQHAPPPRDRPPSARDHDAFLARIAPAGNALEWSRCLGGDGMDTTGRLALDPQGGGWIVGSTSTAGFPWNGPAATHRQAFVTRFSPAGATSWTRAIGGGMDESAFEIAADVHGGTVVAGFTASPDLDVENAFQPAFAGGSSDAFVARLAATGIVTTCSYLGSADPALPSSPVTLCDRATAVALTPSGDAVVGGITDGLDFPLVAPVQDAFTCSGVPMSSGASGFLARVEIPPEVIEPSAVDVRPWVQPLSVTRDLGASLVVAWEETLGEKYALYMGTIGSLFSGRAYDHVGTPPCSSPFPIMRVPMPPGDVYFLATSRAGNEESSYGRDALGAERPPATITCP